MLWQNNYKRSKQSAETKNKENRPHRQPANPLSLSPFTLTHIQRSPFNMVRRDENEREKRVRRLLEDEERIRRINEEQEQRLRELTKKRIEQEKQIEELKKKYEAAYVF